MPDIGKIFPSRYLKCSDLHGREITVTIKEIKVENVGQKKDMKPVAYFKNADKGMVLNVTNSKRIAMIAGSTDTDDWPGHKIVLYPTETEFAGEQVECIRVRSPKPAQTDAVAPAVKKPKKVAKPVLPEPDDPLPEHVEADEEEEVRDIDPDDDAVPF